MENVIDTIPPEIWEAIFEFLPDSLDRFNVSKVKPVFDEILGPTRSTWLFHLTFPILLDHLSKKETLQCRLVCKQWSHAVDHFLKNNAFHRPVFQKEQMTVTSQANGENSNQDRAALLPSVQLATILKEKQLHYVNCWGMERVNKYLNHASSHARCPILGRSVKIMISVRTRAQLPLLIRFFQMFGDQIWFLKIGMVLRYEQPAEALSVLMDIIDLVPNLKMLDLNDENLYRSGDDKTLQPGEELELEGPLCDYAAGRINDVSRRRVAKVETLRLRMNQKCSVRFNQIFLGLFCHENLQRVFLKPTPPTIEPLLTVPKLAELKLSISSDAQLNNLLQLSSHQIQNLELIIAGPINAALLFQAISHFQPGLRNLDLLIQSNFYSSLSPVDLPSNLLPFTNTKVLGNFPLIKKITLKGIFPSLNFLHGQYESLRYLHIANNYVDVMEEYVLKLIPGWNRSQEEEILDLLEILNPLFSFEKNKIHQSNIWIRLPRLKVLTVEIVKNNYSKVEKFEYR